MDFYDYTPYLQINGASRHAEKRSRGDPKQGALAWNEKNNGFGLIGKKISCNTIDSLGIGQYLNSLGKDSFYGTIGKQRRLLGNPDFHLDLGGRAGLVTGYDIPLAPMLQPLLTLGGKNFDINVGWQPKIDGITPEVYMFNADYRLK